MTSRPNFAELLVRAGVVDREAFAKIGAKASRRRRRPVPLSKAALAFAELHLHWTHLHAAFNYWKELPGEQPAPGECTLARILTMFIQVKVVTVDEAIQVFHRHIAAGDDRATRFLRAGKPLLRAARRYLPALTEMRSRWIAHGYGNDNDLRESPIASTRRHSAPRDERELAFVIASYLQYFVIAALVFPEFLLQGNEQGKREVARAVPRPSGPTDEQHSQHLRDLCRAFCANVTLDELPLVAYDPNPW